MEQIGEKLYDWSASILACNERTLRREKAFVYLKLERKSKRMVAEIFALF